MSDHPLTDGPLPYRNVLDCGPSYDEFACSYSTLSWLEVTWSDVALQVVEQCPGGHNVIVKAWPKGVPGAA